MNWIDAAKDLIIAGSALVAAFVAMKGLGSWKLQQRAKIEYDLARRILINTYKLRDAIGYVRAPFIAAGEMDSPPEDSEQASTAANVKHYQLASAYRKRFAFVDEARSTLMGDLLEAEVLWGKPVREAYEQLFRLASMLAVTIQLYLDEVKAGYSDLTGDERKEQRDIIYETGDHSKDSFSEKLRIACDEIEAQIRPALKRLG